MPQMTPADHKLSMLVSPRARRAENNEGLRDLQVHRLSDTIKAVGRAALRTDDVSVFCEGCKKWTKVRDFPLEWDCPGCDRSYRTELVIFEEVVADDEEAVPG